MPFVSEAQRRKFYADPRLHKFIPEFEAATPRGKLPEHVADKKKLHKRLLKHHARRHARHVLSGR